MGDLYLRSNMLAPYPMGAFPSALPRPGIMLRGPDRRSRLIQLPPTYMDLVEKAASIFSINRATHDITIVLVEDEDCEIAEESLSVLHDRERLLVKVHPRPGTEPMMLAYQTSSAMAGPSQRRDQLHLEPPPAPSPALLDLQPIDHQEHNPSLPAPAPAAPALSAPVQPAPPASQSPSSASKSPLPSAMKVKTCPIQANLTLGSTSAHTSLNSATGVAAPLIQTSSRSSSSSSSTSSSSAASTQLSPSPSAPSAPSASSPAGSSSNGLGVNLPQRRKRDVRKERKKHAQRTIAREKAAMEAEAEAAAQAVLSPSSSQSGANGSGGTPTGSQSRRRISFVGVPDESDEDDRDGREASQLLGAVTSPAKVELDEVGGTASKTMWDPEDNSDGSQESPAKRRKLNVDAAHAARVQHALIPIANPSPLAAQQRGPTPQEEGGARKDRPDSSSPTVSQGKQKASIPPSPQIRSEQKATAEPANEQGPEQMQSETEQYETSGRSRSPVKPEEPSPAAALQQSPIYLEVSDSEEEEISSASPQRQAVSCSSSTQSSPRIGLPRGRPPSDPRKRAEYEQMKYVYRLQRLQSPDKPGQVASPSPSQELKRRGSSSDAREAPLAESSNMTGQSAIPAPETGPRKPSKHAMASSMDIVGETPPVSPVLEPVVELPSPTSQRTPHAQLATPPAARQLPKMAPASRGGIGATTGRDDGGDSEAARASSAENAAEGGNMEMVTGLSSPTAASAAIRAAVDANKNGFSAATASSSQSSIRNSTINVVAAASNVASRAMEAIKASLAPAEKVEGSVAEAAQAPATQLDSTSQSANAGPLLAYEPTPPPTGHAEPPSGPRSQQPQRVATPPGAKAAPPSFRAPALLSAGPNPAAPASSAVSSSSSTSTQVSAQAVAEDAAQVQARINFEYRNAAQLIDSLMKHPSNEFTQGNSARDFSRFLRGHPQGWLNLLSIRTQVQERLYHGDKFAETRTQDEPLVNLAADLKRSWANMRSFFGSESRQAKNVGELEKFSSEILNEWVKRGAFVATARAANGKGQQGGDDSAGTSASGASALNAGHSAKSRSGSSSGRSTPVLDAKAIQNAARNGGQLPSALGLTTPTAASTNGGDAGRSTTQGAEAAGSGMQHYNRWLEMTRSTAFMAGRMLTSGSNGNGTKASAGAGSSGSGSGAGTGSSFGFAMRNGESPVPSSSG
ncbi:hypothetical protein OC842_002664 [Tilletia horrida]|uniref:Uncharacterized protein n=1 Tax=Tilletia horrida TaxID=155126 RepID=A0AAN6JS03_9BASI|nr:hypothetical protein OC842_002664 [Tilletia horrida]KAK0561825.1 hypothetical protein OC844_003011 [Tilletia horrida]